MQLIINGKVSNIDAKISTVADLVLHLQLSTKRLAIECNGEIVPRSHFSSALLADGDTLEIVGAVGGG